MLTATSWPRPLIENLKENDGVDTRKNLCRGPEDGESGGCPSKSRGSTNCVFNLCKKCCLEETGFSVGKTGVSRSENVDFDALRKAGSLTGVESSGDVFCPKHQLRRALPAQREVKFSTSLRILPPWLEYPTFPRYSIGWRMGGGEDYWDEFWTAYQALTTEEKRWYRHDFPEPAAWSNVYAEIGE